MNLVSVIVPVYRVEMYLNQCVDSLLSQTYANIEVILVDDASPDGCPAICDRYAQQDERVKVIHKECNAGLGEARNTGLEHVSGSHVCFVDSDDWLEPKRLEILMRAMEQHHGDIVIAGFCRRGPKGERTDFPVVESGCVWRKDDVRTHVLLPMIAQKSDVGEDFTINMCVWTNLYRADILQRENIRFLSEREYLSEDICFNLEYLLHAARVVMLPDTGYCYRYNPASLTSRYKGQEYQMLTALYGQVCRLADLAGAPEEVEYRKQRFFLTKTREVLFRLAGDRTQNWGKKRRICRQILMDPILRRVLSEYPIRRYKMKYKVPARLMQWKCSGALLAVFHFWHFTHSR